MRTASPEPAFRHSFMAGIAKPNQSYNSSSTCSYTAAESSFAAWAAAGSRDPLVGEGTSMIAPTRPLRVVPAPTLHDPQRVWSVYPASCSQQRLWFLNACATGMPAYNLPVAMHLVGPLDRAALERTLRQLVQRHDVLRATFALEEGRVVQQVASTVPLTLATIDLEGIPSENRHEEAQRRLEEFVNQPFDLAVATPFRAALVRITPLEHVMVWSLHAIAADNESVEQLCREASDFYAAEIDPASPAAGRPLPAVQFADYAAWQESQLSEGSLQSQLAYWREQLAGEIAYLDLPTDRIRPATESFRGRQLALPLDGELMGRLDVLAQTEGATLFMVLLAAYNTLLHRYSGQDDLIVGVPLEHRSRSQMRTLVGPFVNTLALRTTITSDLTFSQVLARVRQCTMDAFAHKDVPFDQVIEALNLPRDAARMPLFQSMFALQEHPAAQLALPGLQCRAWPVSTRTAKFDLRLSVERAGTAWTTLADYCTDLFEAQRIERLLQHWQIILESVATDPHLPIAQVPLLTSAEKRRLLVDWNATATPFLRDCGAHQLFEAQAARTPTHVTAWFEGRALTYGELNAQANRLAHHLRALGVGPDVPVGLCLDRSFDMITAVLAVLKAGGAYVPLDPNLPPDRLSFLLSDAACSVILLHGHFHDRLPVDPQRPEYRLVFESLPPLLVERSAENPPPHAQADHLAYVMFTSGSTGRPKGVEMPHRALVNLIQWQGAHSRMGSGSRTLQFASLGFDVSFQEMFSTWAGGGALVLASDVVRQDTATLAQTLATSKVERLYLPFVMLERLAEFAAENDLRLPDLKEVIVAGEQLRIGTSIRCFFHQHPGCALWNHYGPTESHVVTAYELPGDPSSWPDLPSIGRALANCQIYLLDSERAPVPLGAIGELWIGGECLARGYRRRPDLTAERFFPNPYHPDAAARLYRTGDLCRFRDDGTIEYLGRRDHQIKIRGYRVELGEIEAVLSSHPEVAACSTIARDVDGQKSLAAFVVPRNQAELSRESLRAFLKSKLPDYMVPAHYLVLERLPLSPNGKVDRKALAALQGKELQSHTTFLAPRTPEEQKLAEIWCEVLRRDRVGVHDNFFDLGGHSLTAARLASEIKKRLGRNIAISALFQAPTVAALASFLEGSNGTTQLQSLVALQTQGQAPSVFCIHGWGGNVYSFLDLARAMGQHRPVFGLQAVGLDGRQPRHTTVEQMAAHYVQEIRAWNPQGPYHLIGQSLGGWITYEVARQLAQTGAKLSSVTLLDSQMGSVSLPRGMRWKAQARHLSARAQYHVARLQTPPPEGRLAYLMRRLGYLKAHLTRRPASLELDKEGSAQAHAALYRGWDYFADATLRYCPPRFDQRLIIMAPQVGDIENRHFWKYLVKPGIEVHHVPGDHFTMLMRENAGAFAAIYREVLRRADEAASCS